MSRKKHTHQSKSEAHADEVVLAQAADGGATPGDGVADPFQRATVETAGRIHKLIKTAEELARTRLTGTRIELLMDSVPARLEKAVDAALDRVGLVRKSKLPGARTTSAGIDANAQPAE